MTGLMDGCPSSSSSPPERSQYHLCDISVLTNRVSQFATRKDAGCGDPPPPPPTTTTNLDTNNTGTPGADGTPPTLWSAAQQSSKTNPRLFLGLSMVASFVLSSLLTCLVVNCNLRRFSITKQRAESQLVMIGDEEFDYGGQNRRRDCSSDPMESTDEPDVVID